MHVRLPIRPVLDDVVVVRDFDVVEIDAAELWHLRDQEVRVALPPGTAGVGRTALRLEDMPVQGLLRRDHERLVDLRECGCRRFAGGRALGPERIAYEHCPGRDAGCGFEKVPPGMTCIA